MTFRQYMINNVLRGYGGTHKTSNNRTVVHMHTHYLQHHPCVPENIYTYTKYLSPDDWRRSVSITMEVGKYIRGVDFVKAVTNVDLYQFQNIRLSVCDMELSRVKELLGFTVDDFEEERIQQGHGTMKIRCCKSCPDLWTAIQEFKRLIETLDNMHLINVCACCWHGKGRTTYLSPEPACASCCKSVRKIQKAWRDSRSKRVKAATTIQQAWRRCISDPSYTMCKNRLAKEFEELQCVG